MMLTLMVMALVPPAFSQRLQPSDLNYLGAFRLPGPSGGSDWNFSGYGATYYPGGDPGGANDGFPGSIFAIGHDHHQQVSEISIPVPGSSRDLNQFAVATTLQPFADITGQMFGPLEIARADLEYLPAMGTQRTGKLHFCWGQHFQFDLVPSHGWSELSLSSPAPKGPWFMGKLTNYITNDYLFEIPEEWANAYAGGKRLATGRFRDGGWGGHGPALFAYAPWAGDDPPPPQSEIVQITQLLTYGRLQPGSPEVANNDSTDMVYYQHPDEWSGGAWLTAGGRAAVIFIGTKAMGHCWYGFSNGVVWPENGPYPPVPDPPHDQRGWWADSIQAQILFYDPQDLAQVAQGRKAAWWPQPYAVMNLNPYLIRPGYEHDRYKSNCVGACCFDRRRGLFYFFERLADEEKCVVHCFQVKQNSTRVPKNRIDLDSRLEQNYPNPFNAQTVISFTLARSQRVRLAVYDLLGREVATIVDQTLDAGAHRYPFSAAGLPSGVYLYKLETSVSAWVQKLAVIM